MLKVSVIIPTYNRVKYLREAVQSVFTQRLSPFEIIIVDDGSTDNTATFAQTLEPRVRYVRQEHHGVAAARNLGLDLAQGDLIAWLDSDDLWEPDFLATLVPLLREAPHLAGLYAGFVYIDAVGKTLTQAAGTIPLQATFSRLIEANFIVTPALIVRRHCFNKVGAFDTQFKIAEDYDMWLRLAKEFTIQGVQQPLVKIRVHENNTMANLAGFCQARLALARKHFGKQENPPATWSVEKQQGYAYAFRDVALKHIQSGLAEQGWQYLKKAAVIYPPLWGRLDTFYEIACGKQPRGYRGQVDVVDIRKNGRALMQQLDRFFANTDAALIKMRSAAYSNAYLALTMLSDQAGEWQLARRYLLRAIRADPKLLVSYAVVRRLLKLHLGKKMVSKITNR
ncbi:MAG: glycosyltransferase [Anaerolineae bacterium]|nr:glycosyltransferase [Anaerolineae bacterium]